MLGRGPRNNAGTVIGHIVFAVIYPCAVLSHEALAAGEWQIHFVSLGDAPVDFRHRVVWVSKLWSASLTMANERRSKVALLMFSSCLAGMLAWPAGIKMRDR